jgi:hypothetical protein
MKGKTKKKINGVAEGKARGTSSRAGPVLEDGKDVRERRNVELLFSCFSLLVWSSMDTL